VETNDETDVKTESDLEHVNKGMVVDTKREEF
jgi:hypothetical protein